LYSQYLEKWVLGQLWSFHIAAIHPNRLNMEFSGSMSQGLNSHMGASIPWSPAPHYTPVFVPAVKTKDPHITHEPQERLGNYWPLMVAEDSLKIVISL
jgi:hypothetical protein